MSFERTSNAPLLVLTCEGCGRPVTIFPDAIPAGKPVAVICQACSVGEPTAGHRYEVQVSVVRRERVVAAEGEDQSVALDERQEVLGGFAASAEAPSLVGALPALSTELSRLWEKFQEAAPFAEDDVENPVDVGREASGGTG